MGDPESAIQSKFLFLNIAYFDVFYKIVVNENKARNLIKKQKYLQAFKLVRQSKFLILGDLIVF